MSSTEGPHVEIDELSLVAEGWCRGLISKRFVLLALALLFVSSALFADSVTRPRHDFPRVGDYEVLCGDFHMHTVNSDGKLTTRERVQEAYDFGYDVIAITDHYTTRAYRVAKHVAEPLGMIVVRGLETGIAGKEHVLALGVSDQYQPRNPHRWAEKTGEAAVFYQDQLQRIAEDGGIVIYNHPHVGLREPVLWGIQEGAIRGVEVKNAVVGSRWNTVESHGTHCYPFAFDWALEHNLAVFANSDVHRTRSGQQPVTLVLVEQRTAQGVVAAIRARRTVAWFEGMLWGPKELLSDLMKAVLEIRTTSDGRLAVTNRSPVPLKSQLGDLEPYQMHTFDWDGSADNAEIRLLNVWTSSKDNLVFAFSLPGESR